MVTNKLLSTPIIININNLNIDTILDFPFSFDEFKLGEGPFNSKIKLSFTIKNYIKNEIIITDADELAILIEYLRSILSNFEFINNAFFVKEYKVEFVELTFKSIESSIKVLDRIHKVSDINYKSKNSIDDNIQYIENITIFKNNNFKFGFFKVELIGTKLYIRLPFITVCYINIKTHNDVMSIFKNKTLLSFLDSYNLKTQFKKI